MIRQTISRSLRKVITILSVLTMFLAFIYVLRQISINSPLEIREGAVVITTDLLAKGQNPYSLLNMPVYANVYGIFYNLIVLPFANIFGVSFAVHRLVSLVFIVLSCYLVYKLLLDSKIPKYLSVFGVSLLFCQITLKGYDILARPDSLGLSLFLLSLLIPFYKKFSFNSLVVGALFGILAFLTKPYFILGIFYLGIYLFFFKSKKRGFCFLVTSLLTLSAVALIMNYLFETYLINTVFSHLEVAGNDSGHLKKQVAEYIKWNFGIITAFGIALFYYRKKKRIDLISFSLIASILVVFLKMGLHSGNYMTYFTQLITPFFLFVALKFISKNVKSAVRLLISTLLLVNILYWYHQSTSAQFNVGKNTEYWIKWEELLSSQNNVYNSPLVAHVLARQNKPIYDTGQTEYYLPGAKLANELGLDKEAYPRYLEYKRGIINDVTEGKFDLVTITKRNYTPFDRKTLKQKYKLSDIWTVSLFNDHWPTEIWVKKK